MDSWHLIVKIRFHAVSQTLHATVLTAIQRTANFFLISKSVCTNCPHLGANFPLQITIQRQFIIILHVDGATRYTEIPITGFIGGELLNKGMLQLSYLLIM